MGKTKNYGKWARSYGAGAGGKGPAPSPPAAPAKTISCGSNSENLVQKPGMPSQLAVKCPANCGGSPWGTGIYTSDSPVCAACIHSGQITKSAGGICTITKKPGQPSYQGTSKNGIKSKNYGKWARSYGAGAGGKGPAPSPPAAPAKTISCGSNSENLVQKPGMPSQLAVKCPS